MIYDFNVQEPYRTFLINWQKTIEWRLNKGKFLNMKKWEILRFPSWEQFLIENITHHNSFLEMIKTFWKENIIPDATDDISASKVYYRFYSPDDEKKYWVLALHVKILTRQKTVA